MMHITRNQSGVALPVLIVGLVVVVVLAAVTIPSALSGPAGARDAKRKSDLAIIKTALTGYYRDKKTYPTAGGIFCIPHQASCLGDALTGGTTPYLKTVPKDPLANYSYRYVPLPENCSPGACTGYELRATLENRNDKAASGGVYEVTSASTK